MFFNEKSNTDINDNFDKVKNINIKKIIPYIIFLIIFILGIVLLVIAINL